MTQTLVYGNGLINQTPIPLHTLALSFREREKNRNRGRLVLRDQEETQETPATPVHLDLVVLADLAEALPIIPEIQEDPLILNHPFL